MVKETTSPVKGLENILLRVPSKLKERMAETAKDEKVSQNTLMTASLFLSTLAWGKLPIIGPPENILMLLDQIDQAAENDDLAFGAFHVADWADVERFVRLFEDYGFVRDFQHRIDAAAKDTIAYRFFLTKLGDNVLPLATWMIRVLIDCKVARPEEVKDAELRKR